MKILMITLIAGLALTGLLYSFADFSIMDSLFVGIGTSLLSYAIPLLAERLKTRKENSSSELL